MNRWASLDTSNKIISLRIDDGSDPSWARDNLATGPAYWVLLQEDELYGVGDTVSRVNNSLNAVKPFPSWTPNELNTSWVPPVPYPGTASVRYTWNETTLTWIEAINE